MAENFFLKLVLSVANDNDGKLIIMINDRINKKNFFLSKNEILALNKKLIFIHILI